MWSFNVLSWLSNAKHLHSLHTEALAWRSSALLGPWARCALYYDAHMLSAINIIWTKSSAHWGDLYFNIICCILLQFVYMWSEYYSNSVSIRCSCLQLGAHSEVCQWAVWEIPERGAACQPQEENTWHQGPLLHLLPPCYWTQVSTQSNTWLFVTHMVSL